LEGVPVNHQLALPDATEPLPDEPMFDGMYLEIETLHEKISALEHEIRSLESINDQLNSEIDQLQNEKDQLLGQISELTESRDKTAIPGVPFTSIITAFVILYHRRRRVTPV
jgi:FtsZ-binding cell division protein ZapB